MSEDEVLMSNALGLLVDYIWDLEARNPMTRLYAGRRAVACLCERLGQPNPLEVNPE